MEIINDDSQDSSIILLFLLKLGRVTATMTIMCWGKMTTKQMAETVRRKKSRVAPSAELKLPNPIINI
jgi:hypothetical protein